jgi:hypothetical protein
MRVLVLDCNDVAQTVERLTHGRVVGIRGKGRGR